MVNPVTIPISTDGGPCGDPHALSSEDVGKMTADGSLRVGVSVVSELTRIFNLMFYIPTFQRPSASLFIGARAR